MRVIKYPLLLREKKVISRNSGETLARTKAMQVLKVLYRQFLEQTKFWGIRIMRYKCCRQTHYVKILFASMLTSSTEETVSAWRGLLRLYTSCNNKTQ